MNSTYQLPIPKERRTADQEKALVQRIRDIEVKLWRYQDLSGNYELGKAKRIRTAVRFQTVPDLWLHHTKTEWLRLRNELISEHYGLVVRLVGKYSTRFFTSDDFVSEGMVGLMTAVDRFDHTRGARFSTFASYWIRQNVHRTAAEKGLIHESIKRRENRRKITRARDRFETRYGHEPETEEVSRETGLSSKTVERTTDKLVFHSMSNPVSNSEQGVEFGDLFESDRPPSDELIDEKQTTQHIRDLLARLPIRERLIVQRRFEFADEDCDTREAIGDDLGVSREWNRQVQNNALGKLRRAAIGQGLSV